MFIIFVVFIVVIVCLLFLAFRISGILTRSIIAPIDRLLEILGKIDKGDVNVSISDERVYNRELIDLFDKTNKVREVLKFRSPTFFEGGDDVLLMNYAELLQQFIATGNESG
jgi:nitrogen fixation/metabolism regulation signal transduction histidine kinase